MRPECKNCKHKIYIHPMGYIDCRVWGSLLGYNNAADCPYFDNDTEQRAKNLQNE